MVTHYSIFLLLCLSAISTISFAGDSIQIADQNSEAEQNQAYDPFNEFRIIETDIVSVTLTWTRVFSLDNEEIFPSLKRLYVNIEGDTIWIDYGKSAVISTDPDRTHDTALIGGLNPATSYTFVLSSAWGLLKMVSAATTPGIFGEMRTYGLNAPGEYFHWESHPIYHGCAVDLNLDGRPDIALANGLSGGAYLSIIYNYGDETFDSRPVHIRLQAEVAWFVCPGDFNGDDAPDLVVAHDGVGGPNGYENSMTASIFLNNGQGTLVEYGNLGNFGRISSITVVDYDLDGDQDMLVSYKYTHELAIYLNIGKAKFERSVEGIFACPYPVAVAAADFNRDGYLDLASADHDSMVVTIYMTDEEGLYHDLQWYDLADRAVGMAAVDFNGDTYIDLAVAESNNGGIAILVNDGTGEFKADGRYAIGHSFSGICAADLDNDGDIDLAATSSRGGAAFVVLNSGDGKFELKGKYGSLAGNSSIFPIDFDGDGDIDLIATNLPGNCVEFIFNNTIQ
jgi:hypothetical protein